MSEGAIIDPSPFGGYEEGDIKGMLCSADASLWEMHRVSSK